MEKLVQISFLIISQMGYARSKYIEAYRFAKKGNFESAKESLSEGDKYYLEGHNAHAQLIQKEANGENVLPSVLLMHAEDQLMCTETTKLLAVEIIDLHNNIGQLEKRLESLEAKHVK